MIILGINAYHGDSSTALLIDGQLVAAVEEERIRRIKHWAGFPSEAIRWCLKEAGVRPSQIDHIAFSRNPTAHFVEKAAYAIRSRPRPGFVINRLRAMSKARSAGGALGEALDLPSSDLRGKMHRVEHHLAHSASAFFVSPFEKAAVVSIDAMGDFRSTLISDGEGSKVRALSSVGYPHSLGVLYTAVTQYLGFLSYGDEYKVMGLASYGSPAYLDEMRRMVSLGPKGTFKLDQRYFSIGQGVRMTWDGCAPEIGRLYSDCMVQRLGPARVPGAPVTERDQDLARSLQAAMEEVYFHVLNYAYQATGKKALALAGGVAFNSVANGKIFDNTPFEDVYIQSAAGDGGTSLGAASYVYNGVLQQKRNFVMRSSYWGPQYGEEELQQALKKHELASERPEGDRLYKQTAQAIADGKIVGWFQGRVEWGPRALGNRSILADPRRAEMKDILNARIKRREPFRPFAPSILEEAAGKYFERDYPDPFMIKVYPVKPGKRAMIPAVTHVDGTGRLQTVNKQENPTYWQLIKAFETLTGIPVVLNTSFNENEPIVCTPDEAIDCFLRTKMDVLVLGPFYVEKPGEEGDEINEPANEVGTEGSE